MSDLKTNLCETFAVLEPNLRVSTIDVSPTLYAELDERFDRFAGCTLVSSYEFTESWTSWERHPAGDEIVLLIAGSASLTLETDEGVRSVELSQPGTCVILPKGVWHTADVDAHAQMLFVTPGEGTEHRPRT